MSTYTDSYAPALVSEVPAVPTPATRASLWTRLVQEVASRRDSRTFERAIRNAEYSESHDLLALRRRD